MKFVQKDLGDTVENSSGGGSRGMACEAIMLGSLTLASVALIIFLAGVITDFAVTRITPEVEQAMFGDKFFGDFDHAVPTDLQSRWSEAEAVFERLKTYEGVPDIEYTLLYNSEERLNAFAIPGGGIALTDGLLRELDEEIALAFVLAHELGHFAGRDHLQTMGRQLGVGISLQILMGGTPDRLTESAVNLVQLNYSRDQERAADAFAIKCLDAVYGEHAGAEKLFELLDKEAQLPSWAYMFQTHPENAERIKRIRGGE